MALIFIRRGVRCVNLLLFIFLLISFPCKGFSETVEPKEVLRLLAETYVATGQHGKAIGVYNELLEKNPDDIDARIHLAELLSWGGQYDESIAEYRIVLSKAPGNLQGMKRLAKVYQYTQRFDDAEQLYRECIKENPDEADLYTSLGELLTWERKYDEATYYFHVAIEKGETRDANLLLGRAILYSGNPEQAKEIFLDVLQRAPNDLQAKLYLAESYSYNQEFPEAIAIYKTLLEGHPDALIERKLADVLSWDRQYAASIALYDVLLQKKYSVDLNVQKARVMGWAQWYTRAENEYKSILAKQYSQNVALEMEGKVAYWDRDWILSEKKYTELVALEPTNVEAWFDLSQIYSYRMQWQDAIDAYHRILSFEPNHFRAKEGLQKVCVLSNDVTIASDGRRFKAISVSRSSDINERQFLNAFRIPITMTDTLNIDYNIAKRHFFDYPNILEHQTVLGMTHLFGPESWFSAYFGTIEYRRGMMHKRFEKAAAAATTTASKGYGNFSTSHRSKAQYLKTSSREKHSSRGHSKSIEKKARKESPSEPAPDPTPVVAPIPRLHNLRHKQFNYWGAEFSHRPSDFLAFTLNYDKQRLDNDSTVIVKGLYQNLYRARIDLNCYRDLQAGIDYSYAHYSDGNRFNQPAADIVYCISRDPKRLYVKYRYYWMNFKKMKVEYWTPQHLSTHYVTVGWRQYLNEGEVFFGQHAIYYDLKYEPSIDSTHVVENKFTAELNWDINERFNVHARASILRSSHNIYRENGWVIGLKYSF